MKPILNQSIHIELKPSALILSLLSLISIVCSWILLALPIAPTIKLVLIAWVNGSSLYFILRDGLQMLPWSWQGLELDTKGQLTMTNQRGQQHQPLLSESTFIHAKVTILNFKREGIGFGLPPLILFANQANTEEVRRLRVWLRWAKHQGLQYQHQQPQEDLAVND